MTPLFVIGFLFSPDATRVALCQKRDGALAGMWTGIGGAVYDGETPLKAMDREFAEEASLTGIAWRRFAELVCRGRETICFTAKDPRIDQVTAQTPEPVAALLLPDALRMGVPNLRWLVPMALDARVAVAVVNHAAEQGDFAAPGGVAA